MNKPERSKNTVERISEETLRLAELYKPPPHHADTVAHLAFLKVSLEDAMAKAVRFGTDYNMARIISLLLKQYEQTQRILLPKEAI